MKRFFLLALWIAVIYLVTTIALELFYGNQNPGAKEQLILRFSLLWACAGVLTLLLSEKIRKACHSEGGVLLAFLLVGCVPLLGIGWSIDTKKERQDLAMASFIAETPRDWLMEKSKDSSETRLVIIDREITRLVKKTDKCCDAKTRETYEKAVGALAQLRAGIEN